MDSWARKIHQRRDRLPTLVFLGFPCGSAGKESICKAGDLGSIPELGRSPGERNSYPLQYPGLGNSMDCIVQGITKSWTQLSPIGREKRERGIRERSQNMVYEYRTSHQGGGGSTKRAPLRSSTEL